MYEVYAENWAEIIRGNTETVTAWAVNYSGLARLRLVTRRRRESECIQRLFVARNLYLGWSRDYTAVVFYVKRNWHKQGTDVNYMSFSDFSSSIDSGESTVGPP